MDKVYTVSELAGMWQCSTNTVYALLTSRKLHGFKIGGSWRITEEARRAYEQTPAEPIKRHRTSVTRRPAVLEIQ